MEWKIKVLNVRPVHGQTWGKRKVIATFKRKVGNKEYISPKLILNSEFNYLIGKGYEEFIATVKSGPEYLDDSELDKEEPCEALILVIGKRQTARPRSYQI